MGKWYNSADRSFYEEVLGRGPGDPDMYGYPGEEKLKQNQPMNSELKQALTQFGLEEGYTEEEIQKAIESGDDIFGGIL